MSVIAIGADEVGDMFSRDVQSGPLYELPGMSSEDCTSDTCTGSCMGC